MFPKNPIPKKKYSVLGKDFVFDGKGFIPAPPTEFQEKDPIYLQERSSLARKSDLPNFSEYVKANDLPDNIATKDDIPVVDNFALKAQYTDIYYRADAIYENDYIKLKHLGSTNKLYEVKRLTVRTSYGDKNVDSKVVFNNGYCYLFSEYLSQSANWELFVIHYDIVNNIRTYPPDLRGKIGINYMQDENSSYAAHSSFNKQCFETIYSQLGGEKRQALESIKLHGGDISAEQTDELAVKFKFNILSRPYVGGATSEEISSAPDILTVASHFNNDNRIHNITIDENTFLKNTIAVSAGDRLDGSGSWTSHGNGVEFFESYNRAEMDARYPVLHWFKFGNEPDFYTISTNTLRDAGGNNLHLYVDVGMPIKIIKSDGSEILTTVSVVGVKQFTVADNIGTITQEDPVAVYRLCTIARSMTGPQQSATCSIVAAKFAVIQDKTDANWQLVREAARMTASNSSMQVVNGKKVYTPNWDMKRGFGIIDVDKAVEYIEDNYSNNSDYIDSVIPQLPKYNPLVKFEDIENDNPVTKKQVIEANNNWLKNW